MSLQVRFLDRSFADARNLPRLTFRPTRFSHTVIGGPRSAEIEVGGEEFALWQLLTMLRYGVELNNSRGEAVWWGYVAEVQLTIGAIRIGLSIDRMANRIMVLYSYVEPGSSNSGVRAATTWAQNDDSVAAYGTKELMVSISNAVPSQADAIRTAALAAQAMPLPVIEPGDRAQMSAVLVCRGWFDTLNWRYHSAGALGVSYTVVPATTLTWQAAYVVEPETNDWEVGSSVANTQFAQSFQITQIGTAYAMTLTKLRMKLSRVGNQADSFLIDICANNAGVPGTEIGTATLTASQIATTNGWVDISMAAPVALLPATTYWIRARRSGAVDAANFVRWLVNSAAGYSSGSGLRYNGSAWVAQSEDALFDLTGEVRETAIHLGATSAQQQVAQQFRLTGATAYAVGRVKLRMSKAGAPADNLVVDICTDNTIITAPDTVIATSDVVAATALSPSLDWITFTFNTPPLLQPATNYWLKIRRSGATDAVNFYQISANASQGYADGVPLVYNGSGWSSPTPNADVLFDLGGVIETTEQIRSIATGGAGQFLTGVEIDTASNVYSNPYQGGDSNAQAVIGELLMSGTSTGQRLMCQVTQDRRLVVMAEPILGSNDYYLARDGRLTNNMDAPVEKTHVNVGVWARLKDVSAAGAEFSEAGAFTMFIEEMEYQAGGDRVTLKTRETRNNYDVFRLEQG